jgi:signal transduction histidine kinase
MTQQPSSPQNHYRDRLVGKENAQLQAENARLRAALTAANQQLAEQQQQQAREQFDRAQMQDDFIAIVSHELRTPLTSIHGALSILVSGLVSINSAQGQKLLQIAAHSSDRMVRLINHILAVETTQNLSAILPRTDCSVPELLDEVIQRIQPTADEFGIKLNLEIADDPELMVVLANHDRVIQVLVNLINNAIRFSPPNSIILLKAERCGTQVQFLVEDHGHGIPIEHQELVFERFQQVDSSIARQHEGTGLGLAICRNIVQQHQGQIWLVRSVRAAVSTLQFHWSNCLQRRIKRQF